MKIKRENFEDYHSRRTSSRNKLTDHHCKDETVEMTVRDAYYFRKLYMDEKAASTKKDLKIVQLTRELEKLKWNLNRYK